MDIKDVNIPYSLAAFFRYRLICNQRNGDLSVAHHGEAKRPAVRRGWRKCRGDSMSRPYGSSRFGRRFTQRTPSNAGRFLNQPYEQSRPPRCENGEDPPDRCGKIMKFERFAARRGHFLLTNLVDEIVDTAPGAEAGSLGR